MRDAYRIAWGVLGLLGQRPLAWGGGLALVALYAAAYDRPLDALPLLVVWALFIGACRLLRRILPPPHSPDPYAAAALPPPQVAVSVAPQAVPPADVDAMAANLPAPLRRLLRQEEA